MRITVIGSGYVGLVAGACFAEIGHDVVLVDNDIQKCSALIAGECPIHELHLPELLAAEPWEEALLFKQPDGSGSFESGSIHRSWNPADCQWRG